MTALTIAETVPEESVWDRLHKLIEEGRNGTLMLHGFEPGVFLDMLRDGALERIEREPRDGSFYLVGHFKIDDLDVTLFSENLPARKTA